MTYLPNLIPHETEPGCWHPGIDAPGRVGASSACSGCLIILGFRKARHFLSIRLPPNQSIPAGTAAPSQSSVQSVAVVLARNRFQSHSAPQPGPDGGMIIPLAGTGGFSRPISRPSSSRLPSGKYS